MPGRDGTGPMGTGPIGPNRRPINSRRGRVSGGNRLGGTAKCVCPNCGHEETHQRGTPCTETKCPKCGTQMRGKFCFPKKSDN